MYARHVAATELRMMTLMLTKKQGKMIRPSFYAKYRDFPRHEEELHRDCIAFMKVLGWKTVAYEWDVVQGKDHFGKGDMVFQRGPWYLVMEAKRKRSRKVYDQAEFYGAAWMLQHMDIGCGSKVGYGIWTCATQDILGVIENKREAADICWPKFLIRGSGVEP